MPELQYEYYSSVKQQKVDWLWYPYIPYGKITIVQGDPGEGKSTFMINIAALVTIGGTMPDGTGGGSPQTVIYQCAEDNVSDTIKPRLMAAGADCDRVAYIIDNDNELTFEDSRIDEVLTQTKARILIIDPIQAFLVQDTDMQNAARMRSALGALADVASKHQCAVVLVGHLNKSYGGKNLYRELGSIDIAAIARSVLMISRDSTDPFIRYMIPVKSTLGPEGCAIGFSFSDGHFKWLGRCGADIISLEDRNCAQPDKLRQAKTQLARILKSEDQPSTHVFKMLDALNIKKRTVNTAKKELAIQTYRKNGIWYWRLPSTQVLEKPTNE